MSSLLSGFARSPKRPLPSYYNLEVRDQYFSRLKAQIEFNLQISGKKTVIVRGFLRPLILADLEKQRRLRTAWDLLSFFGSSSGRKPKDMGTEGLNGSRRTSLPSLTSLEPYSVRSSPTSLLTYLPRGFAGVPKAMSAILSGEMRDTVEINAAGVYLLEKLFSRSERANLFRSWAGAASMMLKGGCVDFSSAFAELVLIILPRHRNAVWGTHASAPDDKANATLSGGNIYCVELLGSTWRRLMFRCSHFRPESFSNSSDVTQQTTTPNLTMDDAVRFGISPLLPTSTKLTWAPPFAVNVHPAARSQQ